MLLIPCPWCGPRDEVEFRYGGQAHLAYPSDPESLSDEEWADYLFMRDNPRGWWSERWMHAAGCRRWFDLTRNTATNEIGPSYEAGEAGPSEGTGSVTGRRLAAPAGHGIDRSRPLAFTFDGRSYEGFAGDTLASALLANGVDVVARSPLQGRPRGVFSAGVEEPNAFVEISAPSLRPIVPATTVPLVDGLVAAPRAGVGRLPADDAGAPRGAPSRTYTSRRSWSAPGSRGCGRRSRRPRPVIA